MTGCSTATLSREIFPPGTGKTLAYLIPAIEHVIKNPPPGIGVLIIAPSSLWAMSRDMSGHGTGWTVGPVNDIQSGWSYIKRGLIGFTCF